MNNNMTKLSDIQMDILLSKARQDDYEVCVWGAGQLGTGAGKRFLEELKIFIDYYCDNNKTLIGTQIIDGIYCKNYEYLINNNEKTVCFLLVGYTSMKFVYTQLKEAGIKNIITYEDILGYSVTLKNCFPFMHTKDTVIYTCITGDYDELKEPEYISERCDYYLISEKKPEQDTIYQWLDINNIVPLEITDNIFKNRYCKINVHRIFSQYKYSIYIDGNIKITGDITKSIDDLKRTRIAVTTGYEKDTVYSHALRCMVQGLDYPEKWQKQIQNYWLQGLPRETKVYLCNILVREHNNPTCIKLMNEWWKEFCSYVRRDQTSFPYVIWRNGFGAEDVVELSKLFCIDPLKRNNFWEYIPKHKGEKFHI